jgi:hypothetical protein
MEVFKNLGQKVGGAAQSAAKKSSGLVEVTKLNVRISSEQDKIQKLYTQLGKKLYEECRQDMEINQDLNHICKKIDTRNKTIESLQQRILQIKELKVCPNCGLEMQLSVPYCSSCGTKQEIPKITLQQSIPATPVITCPTCNKELEKNMTFCSYCGSKSD